MNEKTQIQANICILPYNLAGVDQERAFRDILDIHDGNLEGVHALIEMQVEELDDYYHNFYTKGVDIFGDKK